MSDYERAFEAGRNAVHEEIQRLNREAIPDLNLAMDWIIEKLLAESQCVQDVHDAFEAIAPNADEAIYGRPEHKTTDPTFLAWHNHQHYIARLACPRPCNVLGLGVDYGHFIPAALNTWSK